MNLLFASVLALTLGVSNPPCKGVTKDNKPCKAVIVNKSGYCGQHDPKAKHCPHVKADGKQCGMVTDGSLCRFHKK